MDMAARLQTRARAPSYLDREQRTGIPDESSGESDSNFIRRKIQRTVNDHEALPADGPTFRKPTLPASATRPLDRPSSFTQRRRSTLRENARIPSGPREFHSPGKRNASFGATATSVLDTTGNHPRPLLPVSNSESVLSHSGLHVRPNQGKPATAGTDGLRAHPVERTVSNFDFLPDINFDDFHTSLQDGSGPVLKEFSGFDDTSRQILRDRDGRSLGRSTGAINSAGTREQSQQRRELEQQKSQGVIRTPSLRQRQDQSRQSSGQQNAAAKDPIWSQHAPSLQSRDRRKSSMASSTLTSAMQPGPSSRPPRKSVGPGLLPGMRKASGDGQASDIGLEGSIRPPVSRTNSFSKSRRTTIQPSTLNGADLPHVSTMIATTQTRASKVKSLQPPPRDSLDMTTPSLAQKTNKSNPSRAHTPSSSGTRRPSNAQSGRASGLGARTISPTDARRLKRQSMANAPPMPSAPSKTTPPLQDENSYSSYPSLGPELPRLAQPSPSLIPRKTNTATPSSTSPDGRQAAPGGGVSLTSLTSKSSYSSLTNVTTSSSTSRLPTPRSRPGVPSAASTTAYGEQYSETETDELVPPVPAIPKAYESPKDLDPLTLFSSSLKSSRSEFSDVSGFDPSFDLSSVSAPFASRTSRASLDVAPSDSPRKRSGEFARAMHRRNLTGGGSGGASFVPPPTAPPKSTRVIPDASGRQNANRQPLRLPPLNIIPIHNHRSRQPSNVSLPHPSDEVDNRIGSSKIQTPEPRRVAKTPSTPMTASKATFFRRHEDKGHQVRSSSSHYALRDVLGMGEPANLRSQFWDDADGDDSGSVPVTRGQGEQRNTITPFSSGSLPKGSGEFLRLRGRPSGDYNEDYSLNTKARVTRGRAQTNGTISSVNSNTPQTPSSLDSPGVDGANKKDGQDKKDKEPGSGGGLRRKLSLSWRRSSSKAANHTGNKSSPQQQQDSIPVEKERERNKLRKKVDMPPPKLPTSATWSGELPSSLPGASLVGRPSLDATALRHSRRTSNAPLSVPSDMIPASETQQSGLPATNGNKPTRLQPEQPQPIAPSHGTRSSSWGNLLASSSSLRPVTNGRSVPVKVRAPPDSPLDSPHVKDREDLLADEEMQRLSRKRKDVDSAARDTEELKKRATAASSMTSNQVLHDRSLTGGSTLNVFERGEIVDHDKDGIFFTGTRSARKIVGTLSTSSQPSTVDDKDSKGGCNNFGYDDERGDYNIVLGDHLAYRYEVVDVLGKGSFGQVVRCIDHKEGAIVAVKIIRNKKRFHQQALVEVGILGKLREWDPDGSRATLSVTGSFYFRSHLCIVTPCLSINLYELIRAHNFVGFQLQLIRRFARQLLACLTLLQTKKIIHCDLKPENILLCDARKADVRVIDFGSSCREEEKVYTYIQSRFYRSPEVILGSSYGLGIDMWSLGCILAELWTGYPLFPGENEQEQLACIMEIFGPPDRQLVERCTRKKLFFDSVGKPRVTVSSKGRRRRPSSKTLSQALKSEDEAFVDFIARCLRWDPDRRLKPSDAMSHPFITNQPLSQRAAATDETRRATRSRPTTAAPAGTIPSPVKRSVNAFAQQQQLPHSSSMTATPAARDRSKPSTATTETPQTALRPTSLHPGNSGAMLPPSASPIKPPAPLKDSSRRYSTITTASAAAMAGNKRTSNGAMLVGSNGPPPATTGGSHPITSNVMTRAQSGNLAAIAARESMAGASAAAAAAASTSTTSAAGLPHSSTSSLSLVEAGNGATRSATNVGAVSGATRWRP